MRRIILAVGLILSLLAFATFATAQDPGDPVPSPLILVQWNEKGDFIPVDSVPALTVVSWQIVPGMPGPHSYNFMVDDGFPKQMTWEAEMPESTPEVPVKIVVVLEITGLPAENPKGRWYAKMNVQFQLVLLDSVGPASETSERVFVIDWKGKKSGKPSRVETPS